MEKSKISRGRELVPDAQSQETAEPVKNGKSGGTGKYVSGASGSAQNKKERRFKDWKTSDVALPL